VLGFRSFVSQDYTKVDSEAKRRHDNKSAGEITKRLAQKKIANGTFLLHDAYV
jgi:hypothetical protein